MSEAQAIDETPEAEDKPESLLNLTPPEEATDPTAEPATPPIGSAPSLGAARAGPLSERVVKPIAPRPRPCAARARSSDERERRARRGGARARTAT